MSKKLIELIENIPGPARRYCHLQLKAFNPNSAKNLYLTDFKNIEKGKVTNLQSNTFRLYNKLLDILFQYYEMNVIQESDTRLTQRAYVLNKLGIKKDASLMNEKAIQIATQEHNYIKYFEAIDQRLTFAIDHQDGEYLLRYIAHDKLVKEKTMKDYLISSEYKSLWAIIHEKILHNPLYGKKEVYENNYYKKLLDKKAEKDLTDEAKLIYYKIHGMFYYQEKKFKEALDIMNKTKIVYDANSWLYKKDPLEYAHTIKRICILLSYLNEFDKIKELLKEYEFILYGGNKTVSIPLDTECIIVQIKLDLIVYSGNYDFNQKEFDNLEKFLFTNYEIIRPASLIILLYSLFLINLHLKRFKKCKKTLNFIFSIDETIRNDVRETAYTAELTLHLLEGDFDLLESKIRAFETRYKNQECFFSYTPEIVPFFRSVMKNLHSKEKIHLLLNDILEKIKKEMPVFHYNHIPLLELENY